jgi:hypothetical protein
MFGRLRFYGKRRVFAVSLQYPTGVRKFVVQVKNVCMHTLFTFVLHSCDATQGESFDHHPNNADITERRETPANRQHVHTTHTLLQIKCISHAWSTHRTCKDINSPEVTCFSASTAPCCSS